MRDPQFPATAAWAGDVAAVGVPGITELLVLLLNLVILVAVAVLVVRSASAFQRGRADGRGNGDPAVEELRLALARGDITEEEYNRRLELLESSEREE